MKYNKIALVFPGQDSRYVGMGKELYDKFKCVRDVYDQARQVLKYDISKKCFRRPNLVKIIMHRGDLEQAIYNQPAVLTTSYACFRVLEERCLQRNVDLNVSFLAGHSIGEYTALLVSGAIDFKTCLNLVQKRASYITELDKTYADMGLMAIAGKAKGFNYERIRSLCESFGVYASQNNTKSEIVVGGHKKSLSKLSKELRKRGNLTKILKAEVPLHTPMMKQAAEKLKIDLDKCNFYIASKPTITNVTTEAVVDPKHIRKELCEQLYGVIDWKGSIEKAISDGGDLFIEVGPARVLSNMIEDIDSSIPKLNVEDIGSLEKTVRELT
jgi:[acyl-carrier-protein] S-malonyltransferase